MEFMLRFELVRQDLIGPEIGPFDDFLQITYGSIRDMDGRVIAYQATGQDGDWYIVLPEETEDNGPWSDIVIFGR